MPSNAGIGGAVTPQNASTIAEDLEGNRRFRRAAKPSRATQDAAYRRPRLRALQGDGRFSELRETQAPPFPPAAPADSRKVIYRDVDAPRRILHNWSGWAKRRGDGVRDDRLWDKARDLPRAERSSVSAAHACREMDLFTGGCHFSPGKRGKAMYDEFGFIHASNRATIGDSPERLRPVIEPRAPKPADRHTG